MSCWALVPVKARADCKSRLAGVVPDAARLMLVRSMLRHVLEMLRATPGVDRIALASAERDDVPHDVLLLPDPGLGLNACLATAADEAIRRDAQRLLILPSDLPLVRSAELAQIIEASRPDGLALAPDRHERGTNAVCVAASLRFPFCFGPDSFRRHLNEAAAMGVTPAVMRSPGLAFDLDDGMDWQDLASCLGPATAQAASFLMEGG